MLTGTTLTLSLLEIILLLFGAISLGITIHFFITSRSNLKATTREMKQAGFAKDEWKVRYLNDMEQRDKEIATLKQEITSVKQRAQEAEENAGIYSIEAEEMRKQNNQLQSELSTVQRDVPMPEEPVQDKPDYLDQLRQAQNNLSEQNQKINQLLGNIDIIREKEEIQRQLLQDNAELMAQVNASRAEMIEKEKAIQAFTQKEQLTKEMNAMLESAYGEFNVLQGKIQKLETQLTSSRMMNLGFEDLKEEHTRLVRDFEEQSTRLGVLNNENKHLQMQLTEVDNKLRDANFQRLQLQKRVAYLEDINNDLQVVADTNKKLEGQLRKIGELESMLNIVRQETAEK